MHKRFHPDFDAVFDTVTVSLNAERVLVHAQHFAIGEDLGGFLAHCSQVVSRDERGCHHAPESKMRPVFVD